MFYSLYYCLHKISLINFVLDEINKCRKAKLLKQGLCDANKFILKELVY